MTFNNLVSIIIPTFNRATKVLDAINSAINQTYTNTQIIVIDDGSTDNTAKLLQDLPHIEYYYKENGGQASARNFGLEKAKGSIISTLDSDDIWNPDFLTRCIEKLEQDQLDFVFANWEQDTKIGESWDFLSSDPFLKPFFHKEKNNWINLEYNETRDLYLRACPSPSSSVVLRKSSMASGWDEEINIGDDWSMYLQMILSKECQIAFTMDQLWRKRIDDINIYDGRKWCEVLEFLYVADIKRKMIKFKKLLTRKEMKILQERYMLSLVELSKHYLIREHRVIHALNLLRRSFAVSIPFTLKTIPQIFMQSLQNTLKRSKERVL